MRAISKNPKDTAGNGPFCYPQAQSTGFVMRRAHQILHHELKQALAFSGVSQGQWYFLRALWEEDGLSQRELSTRVDTMESTTVVALNGMEKSKLIYRIRDTVDRRKVRVHLTESARRMREKLLPQVMMINDRATAGISLQDLKGFHLVVERITANLRSAKD